MTEFCKTLSDDEAEHLVSGYNKRSFLESAIKDIVENLSNALD
jgi:phosphopantothenate synthetase